MPALKLFLDPPLSGTIKVAEEDDRHGTLTLLYNKSRSHVQS